MRSPALAVAAVAAYAAPAFAHTGHARAMLEGFGAGLVHPLGGVDR